MLRDRITRITDGERCRKGRWSGWREVEITHIDEEAAGVRSFVLRRRSNQPTGGLSRRPVHFRAIRRTRTAASTPGPGASRTTRKADSSYRISVLRVGGGSTHWHERMRVGDTVEIRSPQGSFTLDRATPFRVVLISAGIGVTPLLSMLKAHARRPDPPPLLWIHSSRNGATHALRSEAEQVFAASRMFHSHIVYTAPRAEDRHGADFDSSGRLTQERLAKLLGSTYICRPFGREIEIPSYAGAFYVCGPRPFEELVRTALMDLGVEPPPSNPSNSDAPSMDTTSGPNAPRCTSSVPGRWPSGRLRATCLFSIWPSCRTSTHPSAAEPAAAIAARPASPPGRSDTPWRRAVPPAPVEALICCARPDSTALELDL